MWQRSWRLVQLTAGKRNLAGRRVVYVRRSNQAGPGIRLDLGIGKCSRFD